MLCDQHVFDWVNETPYELYNNKKPKLSYLQAFVCKCIVLKNGKDDVGKFDLMSDEVEFVCYSSSSKTYRIYNKRTMGVEESVHVIFDEIGDLTNFKE